jgi:hypothetical protein
MQRVAQALRGIFSIARGGAEAKPGVAAGVAASSLASGGLETLGSSATPSEPTLTFAGARSPQPHGHTALSDAAFGAA